MASHCVSWCRCLLLLFVVVRQMLDHSVRHTHNVRLPFLYMMDHSLISSVSSSTAFPFYCFVVYSSVWQCSFGN